MNERVLAWAAWSLSALLAALLFLQVHAAYLTRQEARNLAIQAGRREAQDSVRQVEKQLLVMEKVVHELAEELESGRVAPAALPARLARLLDRTPAFAADVGVLFRPFAAFPQRRLYGPSITRESGKPVAYPYDKDGDYSTQPWFQKDLDRPNWTDRYFAPDGTRLMVNYSEPFRLPGSRQASGIVRMEVYLEGIQKIVTDAGSGASGYGFLLSGQGVYLADPRTELVRSGRTIFQMAEERQDPGRRLIGEKALKGEPGFAESHSSITGQKTWIFLEPIPRTGWSLGAMVIQDDAMTYPPHMRRLVARIITLALGLVLCLLYLAHVRKGVDASRLWRFVASGSLATVVAVGTLWHFAYSLPQGEKEEDVPILGAKGLRAFQERYGQLEAGLSSVRADTIPTGIFLEGMEFVGPDQVRVSGRIWQKFPRGAAKEMKAGVTLPDAVTSSFDNPLEREVADGTVVFFSFRAVLKQNLASGATYPFDQARVQIWIRPKAVWRSEMLVPDLGAYQVLTPSTLPGLERGLQVPGWRLERSYFSYFIKDFNSNFGMADYVGQQGSPELAFSVRLKRNFLNPFIAIFLPLIAVVGLLFVLVLTVTRNPGRVAAYTYQCSSFLRAAVTLFFPVVVSQINLRTKILADQVLYVEYYYFIVYALILLMSLNALAFGTRKHPLLTYGDNAIPKLAFWPFVLGCSFLVTLLYLIP